VNEVLLTAGVAAIIIAVVGGGAKAFGVDIPVLQSGRRQVALGLVGVVFLGAAVLLRDDESGDGSDATVEGYRQEVLATCRALPRDQPFPTDGAQFEKGPFLEHLGAQRTSWESALDELWQQKPPDSLQEDQQTAEAATGRLLASWADALDRLEQRLPETFDILAAARYAREVGSVAPATRWEGAMSRLAGAPCTPTAAGG
jgi:hypothetical protein